MKLFLIQPLSGRQQSNNIFWAVLFLLLLAATFFIDPRDVSFLSCQFKNSTGYNCPTCGLSRSFYAIANMNISEAFNYHLLGPFLYLWIAAFYVKSTAEILLKKKIKLDINPLILRAILIVFCSVWLIFWISNFFTG